MTATEVCVRNTAAHRALSGEMLFSEAPRSTGALALPIRRSRSWLTALRSAAGDWRISMLTSPTMCTRYLRAAPHNKW